MKQQFLKKFSMRRWNGIISKFAVFHVWRFIFCWDLGIQRKCPVKVCKSHQILKPNSWNFVKLLSRCCKIKPCFGSQLLFDNCYFPFGNKNFDFTILALLLWEKLARDLTYFDQIIFENEARSSGNVKQQIVDVSISCRGCQFLTKMEALWCCLCTNWAPSWENLFMTYAEQQRRRSACAPAKSDQHLYCSLPR